MTSVMARAARPSGPRVLRAALVREGRVIEERLIPPLQHLTVGPSEHATFVIHAPPIHGSTRLIEHGREGYRLCAIPGASGRVATSAGVVDIDASGAPSVVPLGDTARGKIAIGDSVVLFHFVDPPARPPRARLPLSVQKSALGDLDFRTTLIAALSFLLHFGVMGAMYSDWADPVIDDEARVAQMVEIVKELSPPPPVEQRAIESPDAKGDKHVDKAPSKAAGVARRTASAGPSRVGSGPRRVSESRAHAIASELRAMNDAMIAAIGARTGGATDAVLAAGNDVPLAMLDKVAAGAEGARMGGVPGLDLRGDGGGIVKPGKGGRPGLPADVRADARSGDVGKQAAVKKPVGRARFEPPAIGGGQVPDAGRVVGGMRGLLRACYKRALDEDPTMRGSVRVTAQIAPNGDVSAVSAAASGLSSSMVSCVKRVVRGAQFGPPVGGGATVTIPMSFIPQ
jgi:hypothetical protein